MANETTTAAKSTALATPAKGDAEPIIIDLGKKNRRQVRKLRKGKSGRLLDRIGDVIAEATEAKAIPTDAQPVIIIVREKKKRNKAGKMWGLG